MNKTAIAFLMCACGAARADVKLPSIFSDHMVLQRGVKAPLWGWADPGEKVTVEIDGQSQSATADDKGRWRVMLPPKQPPDPTHITVTGKNTININDVFFGEVWLCSGQSNMEMQLSRVSDARAAIAAAKHSYIRFFVAAHGFNDTPQDDLKGGHWEICTPKTARNFSACGYFFGVEIQEKLNVPVGLIDASLGSTRAEAWTPKDALDRLTLPYEPQWTQEMTHPKPPSGSNQPVRLWPYDAPARLYNAMVHPLAGYAMRGAIWYQGESNGPHPHEYADVLSAMITSWRAAWGQGDFTFLIVQLAGYDIADSDEIQAKEIGGGWPIIRAAQAKVARDLPNAGLAVAIDIGDAKDIHPKNKAEVGHRLALAARKIAYGESIECNGPTFKSIHIDGPNAIITFDHTDGLKNKGDTIQGFEISGADGHFVPASATIDASRVIVTSDAVKTPAAVRYGWNGFPTCTLYNNSDLPAVPFWSNP